MRCKLRFRFRALGLLVALAAGICQPSLGAGATRYDDLIKLFREWREFQKPKMVDGIPDYSPSAVRAQLAALKKYQARLAAYDLSGWSVPQKIDYNLVRGEMNGMDFDGRVLHPWWRDPSFYTLVERSESDVPLREGPHAYGVLEIWEYKFPLSAQDAISVKAKLDAIPDYLERAKKNLTEEHKDLWTLATVSNKEEIRTVAALSKRLAAGNPDLVPSAEKAQSAIESFATWVEQRQKTMKVSPAIGIENYNWYLKNVHFIPYTWVQLVAIEQRELQRSLATLALEREHNRNLPELPFPSSLEELRARSNAAIDYFRDFLVSHQIFSVRDYMNQNRLRGGPSRLQPPDSLDVFAQVENRDSLPMKTHSIHWLEKQRLDHEPHPSPIRSARLLYNIWDNRSEGFATAWEEVMMNAGLFEGRPRTRELIYFLVAMRCIRGMADLRMHSGQYSLDEAIKYVVATTPNGWFKPASLTLWGDLQIYAHQPSYGTTYIAGKVEFDHLLADKSQQAGASFRFKEFMDQFFDTGMIPFSLIRWEMTGFDDEVKSLDLRQ